MAKTVRLTEAQLRKKVIGTKVAILRQIADESVKLADLSIKTIRQVNAQEFTTGNKGGALTAMSAGLHTRFAILDFIDSLRLDTTGRSKSLREELQRRHAGAAASLQRSLTDVSARTGKMVQSCLQNRDAGTMIPFGETARSHVTGEHERLMKDMAIVAYLQSLGITSKSSRKADL